MAEYILSHSKKGSSWKKHKYISKTNGRYQYKKDELAEMESEYMDDDPTGVKHLVNGLKDVPSELKNYISKSIKSWLSGNDRKVSTLKESNKLEKGRRFIKKLK